MISELCSSLFSSSTIIKLIMDWLNCCIYQVWYTNAVLHCISDIRWRNSMKRVLIDSCWFQALQYPGCGFFASLVSRSARRPLNWSFNSASRLRNVQLSIVFKEGTPGHTDAQVVLSRCTWAYPAATIISKQFHFSSWSNATQENVSSMNFPLNIGCNDFLISCISWSKSRYIF